LFLEEEEEEDHDACFITNQRILERVCEFERERKEERNFSQNLERETSQNYEDFAQKNSLIYPFYMKVPKFPSS
jgi:hypothetical protein